MALSSQWRNIESRTESELRRQEEQLKEEYFDPLKGQNIFKQFVTKIIDLGATVPNPYQAIFKVAQKFDDVLLDKLIKKPDLDVEEGTWTYGTAADIEKGLKEGEKKISNKLLENLGTDLTAEFVSSEWGKKLGFGKEDDPYNIFNQMKGKFFPEKEIDSPSLNTEDYSGQSDDILDQAFKLDRTNVSSDFKYSKDFLKKQYEKFKKLDYNPEAEKWYDPEVAASYGWIEPEGKRPGYWSFKHGGKVPTLEDIYNLQGRKLSGSGNKSLNQLAGRRV